MGVRVFERRLVAVGAAATAVLLAACSGSSLPPESNGRLSASAGRHGIRPFSTFYGCPVFKGTYARDVTNAAVDPDSDAYISSVIQAGDTKGFYASTGVEQVNIANDQTPMVTVHQKVQWHQFPDLYPWQRGFYIEPLSDAHAMIVQTDSCHLYESYSTTYNNGTLSAYSGANWDMTDRFVPLPPGNPSAMASGLSLFAGMVKWEDAESGSIDHALDWSAIAHTVAESAFVFPASDTDHLSFDGSSRYQLPYGARLRLKASFSTYGWGPEATMVADAMKTYGMYLSDTGSSANGLYFANASDGSNPWSSTDLSALSRIHMSDFEVLKLPPIQNAP
jgi:hypothetical protein